MTTPQHCPGFERFRNLESFLCRCSNCGREIEIFSDEFNRQHTCKQCGEGLDFTKCSLYAAGEDPTPR